MRRLIASALLASAFPMTAAAQTNGVEVPPAPEPDERGAPAPAGGDAGIIKGVEFSIETTDSQTQATMQVGDSRSHFRRDGKGKAGSNWLLRFTTPIPDADALTEGTNLDLLSSGTKLTFSYSFFRFSSAGRALPGGPFLLKIWPEAQKACREEARDAQDTAALKTCDEHTVEECLAAAKDDGARANCEARQKEKEHCLSEATDDTERANCIDPQMPDPRYAKRYIDDSRVNQSLYPDPMIRGGIEGSIGVDRFEFIDPATLDGLKPDKTQYAGAVFFSYYPTDMRSIGTLRLEYQNGYKAADEQRVCKPVVVDPVTDCVKGRPAPAHIERLNFSVQYRRIFEIGSDYGQIAIAPKATYDALSGEYTAEFPIYFVPEKAGPFAPGVSFNYSSTTEKLDTVVFVKGSFSF